MKWSFFSLRLFFSFFAILFSLISRNRLYDRQFKNNCCENSNENRQKINERPLVQSFASAAATVACNDNLIESDKERER